MPNNLREASTTSSKRFAEGTTTSKKLESFRRERRRLGSWCSNLGPEASQLYGVKDSYYCAVDRRSRHDLNQQP